jgi:virulence-associated protein VapD
MGPFVLNFFENRKNEYKKNYNILKKRFYKIHFKKYREKIYFFKAKANAPNVILDCLNLLSQK